MKSARTKTLVLATLGVVAVCAIAAVVWKATRPRIYTIQSATIVELDLATRTGKIEFVHPKTGHTTELKGRIPEACDIQVDGRPATLADVRVGDEVSVCGRYYADYTVEVIWVKVWRDEPPASGANPDAGHARPDEARGPDAD